jgi:hypothetical protein
MADLSTQQLAVFVTSQLLVGGSRRRGPTATCQSATELVADLERVAAK